jgi:nitrous oxide reductase accessory protein NosL
MRPPARLLSLGTAAFAVAVTIALLPPGSRTIRKPEPPANDFCVVAPATPYDPASGLAMYEPRPIPADARCPVCGMYPARYPRWAAQILFRDGAAQYFDSPVNLFVFMHRVDRYNRSYTLNDVAASFVTDFETGQWIELRKAFFVRGSAALGPMRDAGLPAFASRAAADGFIRSRGGQVLTFTQVTPELIRSMGGNAPHRH